MDKEYSREEKIDLYLCDKLSPNERELFEQEIAGDASLQEEVEAMRRIITALERKGEQGALAEMKALSSADEMKTIIAAVETGYKKNTKRQQLWMSIIAAAAVIIGLVYIGFSPKYSAQKLYEEYNTVQNYGIHPSRGGNKLNKEQEKLFAQAMAAYSKSDYTEALNLFNQLTSGITIEKLPEEVVFFAAICMAKTNHEKTAAEWLQYLSQQNDAEYQDNAKWELALTYLKLNNRNKSREILNEIVANKGVHAEKAKKLADDLTKNKWF